MNGKIGYGIRVEDIHTTKNRIINLIKLSKKLEEQVYDWAMEELAVLHPDLYDLLPDDPSFDDVMFMLSEGEFLGYYNEDGESGLGVFLAEVIAEKENIILFVAEDPTGDNYLMLSPWYPWNKLSEETKSLTEDSFKEILRKYIKVLTYENIDIDYRNVVNYD